MRLKRTKTHDPASTLNPRGNLATEIQASVKRALALEKLCGLWTVYQGGTAKARAEGPGWYGVPEYNADAKEINQAIRDSELWDRSGYGPKLRSLKWKEGKGWKRSGQDAANPLTLGVALPSWGTRLDWSVIYDQYTSGALRAAIEVSLSYLPEANREKLNE